MRNIVAAILLLIAFLTPWSVSAQNNTDNTKISTLFKDKGDVHFKFKIASRQEINSLTQIISIDNVKNEEVFAYANEKEFSKFLTLGYTYEIINDKINPADMIMSDYLQNKQTNAWDTYPTYTAYEAMMTTFGTTYPSICRIHNIKTLASGRKLLFAKISKNPDIKENEPTFLYTSSMHGDEVTGYILMLRLIDYLLSNYGIDPRVTRMIDSTEIWINPLANPDGTYHGGNTTVAGAQRENANTIDINRNFPDPNNGAHPDGNAYQDETIAFMGLADTVNFTMSTNFHGGNEVCNYPWDNTATLTADDAWWQFVTREFADTAHVYSSTYMTDQVNGITDGYAWYQITGGRQDYMNYWHHCREFTCEISTIKTPVSSTLPSYWNYTWRSLLNYMEECQYGVRGVVTDSVTGEPLYAKVYISGFDKDSSEVYSHLPQGNYYRHLIAGTYNLTYSCPGYYPKTVPATVINRKAVTHNVQLVPLNYSTSDILTKDINQIDIFPNPATSKNIQINFHHAINLYTISISDAKGDRVFNRNYSNNSKSVQIKLPSLSSGVYFVRVFAEDNVATKKIIIK